MKSNEIRTHTPLCCSIHFIYIWISNLNIYTLWKWILILTRLILMVKRTFVWFNLSIVRSNRCRSKRYDERERERAKAAFYSINTITNIFEKVNRSRRSQPHTEEHTNTIQNKTKHLSHIEVYQLNLCDCLLFGWRSCVAFNNMLWIVSTHTQHMHSQTWRRK